MTRLYQNFEVKVFLKPNVKKAVTNTYLLSFDTTAPPSSITLVVSRCLYIPRSTRKLDMDRIHVYLSLLASDVVKLTMMVTLVPSLWNAQGESSSDHLSEYKLQSLVHTIKYWHYLNYSDASISSHKHLWSYRWSLAKIAWSRSASWVTHTF